MKRLDPESAGDVLRRVIEEQGMTTRLLETRAIALWQSVVGDDLAAMTSRPTVSKGVMTVGVPNPSLRNNLNMSRSALARHINSLLGKDVIKDLRFR